MKLKFWGTRGSIPVPGKSTLKYGGNTPCVEVISDSGQILILDGGTGIRELGNYLIQKKNKADINILFTHYHWDHIQGIPFFAPLYIKGNNITFYGMTINEINAEGFLNIQMNPYNFPVDLKSVNASIKSIDIIPNDILQLGDFKIETLNVNHSSPTITYKISDGNKTIVYMTDNELNSYFASPKDLFKDYDKFYNKNKELIDFSKGVDYLVHDTMYDEVTMKDKKGWGHSSNLSLALFSILGEVKNLVLFHFNPEYKDERIDKLLNETQKALDEQKSGIKCIAAMEGLEIQI